MLAMLLRKTPLVGAKLCAAGSPQAKDTRGKGTRRYAAGSQGKLCVGLVRLIASLGICAMENGMVQMPAGTKMRDREMREIALQRVEIESLPASSLRSRSNR